MSDLRQRLIDAELAKHIDRPSHRYETTYLCSNKDAAERALAVFADWLESEFGVWDEVGVVLDHLARQ